MENNKEKEPFRCECGQVGYPYIIKIEIPESRMGVNFHSKDAYCYKCIRAIRNHLISGTFREELTKRENESSRDKLANVLIELNEIDDSHKEDTSRRLAYAIATLKRIGNDVNIKLPQIRIMADKISKELDLPNFKNEKND